MNKKLPSQWTIRSDFHIILSFSCSWKRWQESRINRISSTMQQQHTIQQVFTWIISTLRIAHCQYKILNLPVGDIFINTVLIYKIDVMKFLSSQKFMDLPLPKWCNDDVVKSSKELFNFILDSMSLTHKMEEVKWWSANQEISWEYEWK